MKTLLKKLVPGVLLLALMSGSALAQNRIATINLQKVFDGYYRTKRADEALKSVGAEMEKSHKEMRDNGRRLTEEYQKLLDAASDPVLSTEEREKRKKAVDEKVAAIRGLEDEINKFERQAAANIAARKETFRKGIMEEIKLVTASKAKAGNYTMVIDSGAQTYVPEPTGAYYTPAVLYNSGEADLTDPVLAELNAGAPVDTTTPGTKTKTDDKLIPSTTTPRK